MIYLKFPHLDLLWTHMAELVECFNRHCFTIMFVNTLNYDDLISVKMCMKYENFNVHTTSYLEHCSSCSFSQDTCRAPNIVCRTP